ncbi:hypothetical protein HYU19_02160 [Candidatus Woesearchaeota archaeon]|nr:hypothetical protein [Candidatus Woesearchaeota archaeon]
MIWPFFSEPSSESAYLSWNEYHSKVTFINEFSRQQQLCREGTTLLETF